MTANAHSARPLDAMAAAIALGLCLSWGFNQVAVKLALAEIPPLTQSAIRSFGAALIVALWARLRGVPLTKRDGTLTPGLIVGILFGLEFLLIYRGLVWTTATRAVVFVYTAPFFVALGARWFLPGEKLSPVQWGGLGLSFLGVAVAIGVPTPALDPRQFFGDMMLVAAGAAWGATTLVVKATSLARAPFEKTLGYQLVVSAPMLAIGALIFGEKMSAVPSTLPLASLLYQTVWVAGITFLAWFALVIRYSASHLSAFTFLTPLFGVAAGYLVLGEPVTPVFVLAVALVIGGLVLVNRTR